MDCILHERPPLKTIFLNGQARSYRTQELLWITGKLKPFSMSEYDAWLITMLPPCSTHFRESGGRDLHPWKVRTSQPVGYRFTVMSQCMSKVLNRPFGGVGNIVSIPLM